MNVLQTDYSNLFAAGLRVIESRSTGRGSSQSYPVHAVSLNLSASDRDPEGEFAAPVEDSPKKTSRFSTKLWRRVSWRREKPSSANTNVVDDVAKPRQRTWRSMLPGCVGQETCTGRADMGLEYQCIPRNDPRTKEWSVPIRTWMTRSIPSTRRYPRARRSSLRCPAPPPRSGSTTFPSLFLANTEQQRRRSLHMPRPRHTYSPPSKRPPHANGN
ncbi:hypothetical protein EDB87DRAFT_533933 [Lactarius vividus]|nr:hypothetical protein EDB87DRAFT_533933 [Lactarius vividus]